MSIEINKSLLEQLEIERIELENIIRLRQKQLDEIQKK